MTVEKVLEAMYGNMENENIIEVIKNPKTTLTNLINVVVYNSEAIIAAIEKQVPHKMTAEDRNDWRCPVCRAYIYGVQDRYCPHCGQALDWS